MKQPNKNYQDLMKSIEVDFDMDGEWAAIEAQLPEKESKRSIGFWFGAIGASVLLAILLLFVLPPTEVSTTSAWTSTQKAKQTPQVDSRTTTEQLPSATIGNPPLIIKTGEQPSSLSEEESEQSTSIAAPIQPQASVSKTAGSTGDDTSRKVNTLAAGTDQGPTAVLTSLTGRLNRTEGQQGNVETGDRGKTHNDRYQQDIAKLTTLRPLLEGEGWRPSALPTTIEMIPSHKKAKPKYAMGISQSVFNWSATYVDKNEDNSKALTSLSSARTSLHIERAINRKWTITAGLHYTQWRDRLNYQWRDSPKEETISSLNGSVFIDSDGVAHYYEGPLTQTTTDIRTVQQYNRYHGVGVSAALSYNLYKGCYIQAGVSQDVLFSQRGKYVTEIGEISEMTSRSSNGGLAIDFSVGWRRSLSSKWSVDLAISGQRLSRLVLTEDVQAEGITQGIRIGVWRRM